MTLFARFGAALAVSAVLVLNSALPAIADVVRDMQWQLGFLEIDRVHAISRGDNVVVGEIDTGVDVRHPDLVDSVLPGIDLLGGDSRGWHDNSGHGTEIAGLLVAHGSADRGALGSADRGALGIAPRAKVLPVAAGDGSGIASSGPKGIQWAVDHGARVICLAFGANRGSDAMESAVRYAMEHDVVLVAAAGNRDAATRVTYPAAYRGVIAVGGVDRRGLHAAVSVTGKEIVLTAPAVDIVSTAKGGGYGNGSGTSEAAAIIAGAAALVRSRFPDLPAAEVVHRLTATARDAGPPGRDELYGYGIVNLVGALTADVPPLPSDRTPSATAMAAPAPAVARGTGYPVPAILLLMVIAAALSTGGWLVLRGRHGG